MNSREKYRADLAEQMRENAEATNRFIESQRKKALESYKPGEAVRYCFLCGEPLIKGSMAYDEGYHFDNCI